MHRIVIDRNHELHVHNESFSVYVSGLRLFRFNVKSRMPVVGNDDSDEKLTLVEKGEAKVVWIGTGGAFEKKEYTLRVIDKGFVFTTKVTGCGAVDRIEYFRGGADSVGSPYAVSGYSLAAPGRNGSVCAVYSTEENPVGAEPFDACFPPYVFSFCNDYNDDWCGIGVTTRGGNQNYRSFVFNAPESGQKENGCWFTLPLGGCTEIGGEWKAPTIWCGFSKAPSSVYGAYAEWSFSHYGFKKRISSESTPDWWSTSVFSDCGENGETHNDSENHYGLLREKLDSVKIVPGIIVTDGKGKNLGGFVDGCHSRGAHVLLRIKFGAADGLPEDECIVENGICISADPTNPKYLERLKKTIHTMLTADEGGLDCDGFKVDFAEIAPVSCGAVTFEKGVAGLELMHLMLGAVYEFAKAEKHDALIISGSTHPYLAEFCDMLYLPAGNPSLHNPISSMKNGAEVAKAVMPGIIIDTGGFSAATAYEQLRIFEAAAENGVPGMHFFPDFFTEKEWVRVREIFNG